MMRSKLIPPLLGYYTTTGWDEYIPSPAVLVMFDDGYDDYYSIAYPIMQAASVKSTCYVISDLLDTEGRLTTAQAQEMYATGHDLGNHSKTHTNFQTLTRVQIEAELSGCVGALDAAGLTRASKHVSYPFGASDADTLAAMSATGMLTGRTTANGDLTYSDAHTTGLYALQVSRLFVNTANINTAKALILDAKTNNKIIAILFHEIAETAETEYQFSTANFTTLMNYIAEIGINSMTISEWYAGYSAIRW